MNIIYDMPAGDYHAHPAVSKSVLDRIARSPLHARAYLDGAREEPTASMQFGTALHTAVLEPRRFADEYHVFEGDRRTKAGKEAYELLIASGATILSRADFDAVLAMELAIRQHPVASELLQDGIAEASVFWQDERTGLECKARPDWWHRERGLVVDLKTTDDASPAGFARSVANYRYHLQAAHYRAGTGCSRFIFIAVEKKAPYAVAVYELDNDAIRAGAELQASLLGQYASCLEFGVWPGYPSITAEPPRWAVDDMFSELDPSIEDEFAALLNH